MTSIIYFENDNHISEIYTQESHPEMVFCWGCCGYTDLCMQNYIHIWQNNICYMYLPVTLSNMDFQVVPNTN